MRPRFVTTEVVVIGGGPSGIAAAALAAEGKRGVVLLEENAAVGGQIWRHRPGTPLPRAAARWIARLERSGATIEFGASVTDVHPSEEGPGHVVLAEQHGTPLLIQCESLMLATGARERFLPFPGWTLPGVVGVGGAQALLKSGTSFRDRAVVIAGSGPLLMPVADALAHDGARVLLVAEQASARAVAGFAAGLWRRPGLLLQAARHRAAFAGTPYRTGTLVRAARGDGRVEEVTVTDGTGDRTIACESLCTGYGLLPNTQLARLLGCVIQEGRTVVDDRQQTTVRDVYAAGESTGVGGVDLALLEGEIAGRALSGRASGRRARRRAGLARAASAMDRVFAPRPELRDMATSDTIVCRCEDVTLGEIDARWTMRQAKLYTRVGMGPCQGRVCGAALECLLGWSTDTVRIPTAPALVSTLLADEADPAAAPPFQGAYP